jgi:arginine/lysine/ornithine decarboxylase
MFERTDEHLMPLVQDYKLNLIAPAFLRDEEFDMFHSDLKEVLLFIKYARDKKKLQELVESDEAFRHMDSDAVKVINKCTGARLQIREKERTVDMCQAIKDLMEDAAAEAKVEAERAKAEASSAKAEASSAKAEASSAKAEASSAKAEAVKATEEKISVLRKSVKAVMDKTGMTLEQTFSVLDISSNDREKLMLLL